MFPCKHPIVVWQRLFIEHVPFIPLYAFNCTFLRQIIQDQRIINELRGKPLLVYLILTKHTMIGIY
jgi:hypothetical protein